MQQSQEELEKEDPDTYKKWQDNGFNINYTFDDQSTLLHIAARNDLVKIAELLIKKGVMLIQQIKMDGILYTLLLQVAV
ncbi:UNVERIFIED_CONTAM: ankyrin repeat domain-containing protein [Wolbachia endosymbiont of Nasonia longicornis]